MRSLPDVAYRAIGRFSVSRFDRVLHPILYRVTQGRGLVGRALGCEMVLLTTVGLRSGRARTVALFAFPGPGGWVVIASRGGTATLPAWYRNLAAEPRVTLQRGGERFRAVARVATGAERSALWANAARAYPGYSLYQQASPYEIPVVVLTPVAERAAARAAPAA